MSYPVPQIINIATRIRPPGLAFANFGKAMLFAPLTEAPGGFAANTYRTYYDMSGVADDFDPTDETYLAAQKWFSAIPTPRELMIWVRNNPTQSIIQTLDAARDAVWWYWTFFTADVYAAESGMDEIAAWADANVAMVPNCSVAATAIRNPATTTDIATVLTAAGNRHIFTLCHATDEYSGIALAAHFAAVLYTGTRTTITGEFKKLPGVVAEDLTGTAYGAMKTKKAAFYTKVDQQGSVDAGRVINSYTHSTYGEYIDDVVNLDAFTNDLSTTLYNALANQFTKLAQDPAGQAVLIGAARETCERYIRNGFLGERTYTDPDDGLVKTTPGYEILTAPEDILTLSDSERGQRKSAPIRVRIFRAGAIHAVDVTVDVY